MYGRIYNQSNPSTITVHFLVHIPSEIKIYPRVPWQNSPRHNPPVQKYIPSKSIPLAKRIYSTQNMGVSSMIPSAKPIVLSVAIT